MEWENTPENIEDYQGFVYLITGPDGRMYVGKKFFWNIKTLPPLKGKKNKRHKLVESDWKEYYGSNKALLKDVEKLGKENFRREILIWCETKWDCAYQEAKLQFDLDVLFDDRYYNGIINCRLKAMKNKKVIKMGNSMDTELGKPVIDNKIHPELLKMLLKYV